MICLHAIEEHWVYKNMRQFGVKISRNRINLQQINKQANKTTNDYFFCQKNSWDPRGQSKEQPGIVTGSNGKEKLGPGL